MDRPIIFSAPMVLALLDGRKTQTQRLAWRSVRGPGICRPSEWQRVQPGDRLWVRESFKLVGSGVDVRGEHLIYDADGAEAYAQSPLKVVTVSMKSRPSIHMPRWASRLTLTVTEVRRQRLQDISPQDAEAEGVFRHVAPYSFDKVFRGERGPRAIQYFRELWDTLHGAGAWDANPEIVAISFRCERRNIDAQEAA